MCFLIFYCLKGCHCRSYNKEWCKNNCGCKGECNENCLCYKKRGIGEICCSKRAAVVPRHAIYSKPQSYPGG